MDTDAPQVSHKPGGEPKIKVSISIGTHLGISKTSSSPWEGPLEAKARGSQAQGWPRLCSETQSQKEDKV